MNPNKQSLKPVVKVFGKGGPSRMWSPVSTPGAKLPNCDVGFGNLGGFTGQYVCQNCEEPANGGVYRVADDWICGPCKASKASKPIPQAA